MVSLATITCGGDAAILESFPCRALSIAKLCCCQRGRSNESSYYTFTECEVLASIIKIHNTASHDHHEQSASDRTHAYLGPAVDGGSPGALF